MARSDLIEPGDGFNGIFAVTPDNLPLAGWILGRMDPWQKGSLAGRIDGEANLWVCAAVWLTHAAGTARMLAKQIAGEELDGGRLDPNRFSGQGIAKLQAQALERYNDIYNSEPQSA